ncbi:mite allergen Lep d 7-like isoform X2 [Amphibalanus amphitrite]|uniref:mite allergen Lep d 7-like isoform X2 n=1 Tax=Amphibalanus amphitrite TaxID=1232801 RepID=UPI001C90F99C|nr:mite allergen Lep d 7-like isoform X2 [Amphibalanus amphitrite]XP_043210448.1 mite allergen Lep d 7-like isoform X2 [Amphibalanus amphitrite]
MAPKKGVLASLYSRFRGPIEQAEEAIIKKWICWILKRHVQGNKGRAKTSDANRFVDNAMEFARSLIKSEGLDPLKVADDETLFEEKLFFIRLSASVTFLATSLKGMSTLRRKGDAILELDGDWLTLQTQLATTKIECNTNCTAKFMDLGPNFDLTVDVDAVTVKMKARINTSTMQIVIPSFEVVHVGDIDAEADGLFPIDSLLAAISELFIKRCKDSIVKVFEFEAQCQLEAALKRLDFTQIVRSYGRKYFKDAAQHVGVPGLS